MTKRTKIIITIILVFLFAPWLVKTGIDTVNEIRLNNSLLVYEIPADMCKSFFGVSVEDFFITNCDYYDTLGDFREYSKIDRKGNLILRMTEEQRKGLIKFHRDGWDKAGSIGADDLSEADGIEVAPDYTSVTVSCYKNDAADKCFLAVWGSAGFPVIQLLNGVEPESVKFEIFVKDALTGDVVFEGAWPKYEMQIDEIALELSERPQEQIE